MTIRIRNLGPEDAGQLFELRRRAVLEEPLAFLASPEDDLASSVSAVRDQLGHAPSSVVFGALDEQQQLVGMIGLSRDRHLKAAHRAHIWGMFVAPQARRQGIGMQLLDAVLRYARSQDGLASVELVVSERKPDARRLYEQAGFVVWGLQPDCVRWEGESAAAHHLALPLDDRVPMMTSAASPMPGDGSALSIRAAVEADLPQITQLLESYMRETYRNEWHGTADTLAKDCLGIECELLLATQSDVVGLIAWCRHYDLHHCAKGGEIIDLYVAPPWRNRGIAPMLITAASTQVHRCGGKYLTGSAVDSGRASRLCDRFAPAFGDNFVLGGRAFRHLAELQPRSPRQLAGALPEKAWNHEP